MWMPERTRRAARRVAWVLTVVALGLAPTAVAEEPTRVTMRRVLTALSELLPAALADQLDAAGGEDPRIVDAVEALQSAAAELESHAPEANAPFAFLSRSLDRDARAIRARIDAGRYPDAAYRTLRMTQTCVACHSRLPAAEGPGFASQLVSSLDVVPLGRPQAARLDVATRQFDRALGRYESLMRDPKEPAAALDYSGALAEYLIVALRVRNEPTRARETLEKLATRPDLTLGLARALPVWIAALDQLAPILAGEPSLVAARRVLADGRSLAEERGARIDLIHRVVVSSLIYRCIEQGKVRGPERAEALLLLGETDAFVRRSFERSEAQLYLEEAIRLAPGTEVARRAYVRLEDETLLGFTGSSGLHLPIEVEERLAELRALSEGETLDEAR